MMLQDLERPRLSQPIRQRIQLREDFLDSIADLGWTNGTRLNGWWLTEEVEVRPGDRVSFGSARYRLAAPDPQA